MQNIFVLLATVFFATAIIMVSRRLGIRDLLSPFVGFPIAYLLFFGLGSLNLITVAAPRGYDWALWLRHVSLTTPLLSWLGLIAYYIGALGVAAVSSGFKLRVASVAGSRPRARLDNWLGRRPDQVTLVTAGIAFAAVAYSLLRSGAPLLAGSVNSGRIQFAATNGLMTTVFESFVLAAIGFATITAFSVDGGKNRRRIGIWCALTAVTALTALLIATRSLLAEGALFILPLIHYARQSPLRLRLLAVGGLAGLLLIGAYGYLRDSQSQGGFTAYATVYERAGIPRVVQPVAQPYLYWRDTVVTFDQVTALVPTSYPYQHGRVLMMGAIGLLPGHHTGGADVLFKGLLHLTFANGVGVPGSVLGIFYVDFGVLGVAIGMGTLGALLSAGSAWLRTASTADSLLGYAFLLKLALWSLFLGPFPYLTTIAVPVILVLGSQYAQRPERVVRIGRLPAWSLAIVLLALMSAAGIVVKYSGRG